MSAAARPAVSSVQIDDVALLPFDRALVTEFSLDLPRPAGVLRHERGVHESDTALDVAGWAIGTRQRVLSVEFTSEDQALRLVPLRVERPDVQVKYREGPQGLVSGFVGQVGLLGMPEHFEIVVKAVVRGEARDDRIRVPVAKIRGRRPPTPAVDSRRQPLMLTSIGRCGTSWTMRLLSEHPGIVAVKQHPYEVRPSVYWMHVMKVLCDPADHERSTVPDGFENTLTHVGQNPYAHPRYLASFHEPERIRAAFGTGVQDEVRRFCARAIDGLYDSIARDQGNPDARYFAEKQLPSHIQWLFWDVYPEPREIILVRDFRDVICSARSFNAKRNIVAFGREKAGDDEQWIRNMADRGVRRLATAWRRRGDRAHLLKYEDLIERPAETLADVFRYLDLDASEGSVRGVLERAGADTAEARHHRTSSDPRASVSRWRGELTGRLLDVANEAMGPALAEFGYAV